LGCCPGIAGRRAAGLKTLEVAVARFIARFMKDVLGENGHTTEICQRTMEIDAPDQVNAHELAKRKFCECENVRDWSLHADRIHITDAEFPS
jgi:hypothetical protein